MTKLVKKKKRKSKKKKINHQLMYKKEIAKDNKYKKIMRKNQN